MADDADVANPNDEDIFIYTTGSIVPRDVVRARVHPSVTVIPANAFICRKLEEVELCEGLSEIGGRAFQQCSALKRIKIPSTVTVIRDKSFLWCHKLEEVELCEGLQTIEESAFNKCHALKRIEIPSTVTNIGGLAFYACCQLEEVELYEGLLEIGQSAFSFCESLKHINLPTTIRSIGAWAFAETKSLLTISLPDGLESIGSYAFLRGGLLTFRIPPLITRIPQGMVEHAESLFSVELSESVTQIGWYAFKECHSLRNLAIPPNTIFENDDDGDAFDDSDDLLHVFGSEEHIMNALKHRFDNLPIHKMLYYQSYESVSVDQLNNAINMRSGQRRVLRSKLDPTGKQQDCLGMTPLHILACSTVQDISLYKLLIDKYPETLITEDEWGALPLLYAIWGNAPTEIVQYLVESYKSLYPDYTFNWTKMVQTLGLANAPKELVQNLINIKQESFPDQCVDWREVLNNLVGTRFQNYEVTFHIYRSFRFIVHCGLAKRIVEIGLRKWRNIITNGIESIPDYDDSNKRKASLDAILFKLAMFENEYQTLKEATTIVELAFWKKRMNDFGHDKKEGCNYNKKMKIEDVDVREQCRIGCGADIVIEHMLPYLLPATDEIEHQPVADSSSEGGDESDDDSTVTD